MKAARRRRQSGITLMELLIAMGIMAIASTMIVAIWVALDKSFLHTTRSTEQVDFARAAVSRLAREIRDAQAVQVGADVPVPFVQTDANDIRFYSTFNTSDASTPTSAPRLTRYVYVVTDASQGTGSIYREFPGPNRRFELPDDPSSDDIKTLLVGDVANASTNTDTFVYWAYNDKGRLVPSSGTTQLVSPSQVVSVQINLQIDVNPGKTPNYTDVSTTVNPRNLRIF